jgi:hypothetical protein
VLRAFAVFHFNFLFIVAKQRTACYWLRIEWKEQMKIEALTIGMKVKHPQYGVGTVKTIAEHTADIRFDDGQHTISPEAAGLQPAEAQAAVAGLEKQAAIAELGLEKPESFVEQMGAKWHNGRLVMHPSDSSLQAKEVPLDVFFHKIVMMRNNLRVLEQKINSHPQLSDGEKVEMQQYISRCYGSMTTFNVLFRNKEDQFGT